MGTTKTEKQLKEETRARRAKHELKNTPLPIKRRSSLHNPGEKKLFASRKWSESNSMALTRLSNKRVATNLDHSRSMTDLRNLEMESKRDCLGRYSSSCGDLLRYMEGGGRYKATCRNLIDKYRTDDMRSGSVSSSEYNSLNLNSSRYLSTGRTTSSSNIARSSLGKYSKSCSNLVDGERDWTTTPSMIRSKSYSRITDLPSSYEQNNQNYRATVRNMYTNIKDFSSRTVSALSSHRTSGSLLGSSGSPRGGLGVRSGELPSSRVWSSTPSTSSRFLSTTPSSSIDSSPPTRKSLRQLQMTNNLMSANTTAKATGSFLSSCIGSSYKQFSSSFNSSSTTTGSKSRFASMKAMFA